MEDDENSGNKLALVTAIINLFASTISFITSIIELIKMLMK